MFYLLLQLFFFERYHIHTKRRFIPLPSFGFKKGGNYSFIFRDQFFDLNIDTDLFLVNSSSIESFLKDFNGDNKGNYLYFEVKNTSKSIKGNISGNTVLYPYLVRINEVLISRTLDTVIEVRYRNPTTFLDSRIVNAIPTELIFTIFYFVVICGWITNWILNWNIQIQLHYHLSFVFVIAMLLHFVKWSNLRQLDKSDYSSFSSLAIGIQYAFYGVLIILALEIAKGFCIVNNNLKPNDYLWYFLLSFGFVISILFYNYDFDSLDSFIIIIGIFIFLMLIIREIHLSLDETTIQFYALLLTQSDSGLLPETTSVFLRPKIYDHLKILALAALTSYVFAMIIEAFINLDLWIYSLLFTLIEFCSIVTLGFLLRL